MKIDYALALGSAVIGGGAGWWLRGQWMHVQMRVRRVRGLIDRSGS